MYDKILQHESLELKNFEKIFHLYYYYLFQIEFCICLKGDNYLVDIKGNVLEKKEDGDYLYKDGDTYVVIKDFDVKHPDQKIPTHRSFIRREKTKKINEFGCFFC